MSTEEDRRAAYVDMLRRIAELTESGVLPLPIGRQSFSLWFRENQGGREKAAVAAEALGVAWHPEHAANDRRYLRVVANVPTASVEFSLYLDLGEPADAEPAPPPPGVAFAAELNSAAGSEVSA